MTAKEMFKELGFEQTICINEQWSEHAHVEYESIDISGFIKRKITFLPKGFYAQLYHYDFNNKEFTIVGGCIVSKRLLKAINQQLKELGWVEDDD